MYLGFHSEEAWGCSLDAQPVEATGCSRSFSSDFATVSIACSCLLYILIIHTSLNILCVFFLFPA